MGHIRRSRRAAGLLAAGALALGLAAAAGSTTAVSAAPAHLLRGGHGMSPAAGSPARWVKAGTVSTTTRPSYPAIFRCQKVSSPVTCFGPDQLRTAYGFDSLINAGYTGAGRTIVIVDAYSDPALHRDLKLFDEVFDLPKPKLQIIAPFGQVPFDPTNDVEVGWSGEIALDVEYAHAMAPGAKIVLVEAKTSDDNQLQAALGYVADNDLGDVVSQSFGEAESCYGVNADGSRIPGTTLTAAHRIYAKMIREGITPFASAGDDGSAQPTCDGSSLKLAASTPASDPYVTGVGGTQLFANPRTGVYDHEITWNENDTYGSGTGGGFSSVYPQPAFQKSIGDFPGRGLPDVAYNAAINHGVLVAWSVLSPPGSFYIFGGTSAGSPQWAALTAITDQLHHGRLGDINPALYRLPSDSFHDITEGNNSVGGVPGYTAAPGWDPTTGLGSPVASQVALNLAGATR